VGTYAGLLEKAGRRYESDSVMKLGMAKGCAAMGDKASAIKYADGCLLLVENKGTKDYMGRV